MMSIRFSRLARLLTAPRFWLSLAVTTLWVGVMGWMWVRDSGGMGLSLKKMGVSPEVLLASFNEFDQWLWIEQGGRRIGLTHTAIVPAVPRSMDAARRPNRERGGYLMYSRTRLNLSALKLALPLEATTQVDLNPAFEMEQLQARLRLAGHEVLVQAFVEGRWLYYRLKSGGEAAQSSVVSALAMLGGANPEAMSLLKQDVCGRAPLEQPIFMAEAVMPVLMSTEKALQPGERWTTAASDPLQGLFHLPLQVTVEKQEPLTVAGETMQAWRLVEQLGELRSTVWYDARGRVLRRDMASASLTLLMAQPTQALMQYKQFDRPDRFDPLDRGWIRQHLSPKLDGQPLSQLLPKVPVL